MSAPIIVVDHLTKRFGELCALEDVSFQVQSGTVVGLIGANGAGKTTTMRILATLETPSAGEASVCGYNVTDFPVEVRRQIGWMPDSYGRYENTTVNEYLDFFT